MFENLKSQLITSLQGSSPQQALQYPPHLQQIHNNARLQIPAPWMAQWSSVRNCWFYVNGQTGESSWVNPSQLQQQPQNEYKPTFFQPQPQQQLQYNYQNSSYPPPPQQQRQPQSDYQPNSFQQPPPRQPQFRYQNTGFPPPLQQQQQQSLGQDNPATCPSLPHQSTQAYSNTCSPPPQQQQSVFQSTPARQYQQQPKQRNQAKPQKAAPAKKSHTGRNIALGLGALVAGVVGVEMLGGDDDSDSGGGWFSSGNDDSSSSGGGFSAGNDNSGLGGVDDITDYSSQDNSGNIGGGDSDLAAAQAGMISAAMESQAVASGFACQDAGNFGSG